MGKEQSPDVPEPTGYWKRAAGNLKAQSLHCDYSDFSDFSPDDLSTHEVLADNSSIAMHR